MATTEQLICTVFMPSGHAYRVYAEATRESARLYAGLVADEVNEAIEAGRAVLWPPQFRVEAVALQEPADG
jgi:hypothetical protein